MLNNIGKILFLLFLLSCAKDSIINSINELSPYNLEVNSNNLNILTWNIEFFPKSSQTIDLAAEIINSLDVDIIALQEITSSLDELTDKLDGNWNSYRYDSNYGALSYIINIDNVSIIQSPYSILNQYLHDFAYRPPYLLEFSYNNQDIVLINIHYKCCGGSEQRRRRSSYYLDQYISNYLSNKNVIVVGDFNDELFDDDNIFDVFLNKPQEYLFTDYSMAGQNNPWIYWSYPTWPSHLDHILISNELFDEYQNPKSTCYTVLAENVIGNWNNYENNVSDHRPVLMSLQINQ